MQKRPAAGQMPYIYALLVPCFILVGLFAFYPAASGIFHSFFRWNGSDINEFTGFENYGRMFTDTTLWKSFIVLGLLVAANLIKMIPPIIAAVCIHRLLSDNWRYYYRVAFVIPMIVPGMVLLLLWRFFYNPSMGLLNEVLNNTGMMTALQHIDSWFDWGVFKKGVPPTWLGDKNLIIPSIMFYGFPWVGIIGVLIYLAGLGNIPDSVYEAAELDGAGWWRKFYRIELPLITTQVRLNLVLMIIQTIQQFGNILILLDPKGGSGGKGMVPGLYMYGKAFKDGEAGYASAIGVMLFVVILILTLINNKFVRVDK